MKKVRTMSVLLTVLLMMVLIMGASVPDWLGWNNSQVPNGVVLLLDHNVNPSTNSDTTLYDTVNLNELRNKRYINGSGDWLLDKDSGAQMYAYLQNDSATDTIKFAAWAIFGVVDGTETLWCPGAAQYITLYDSLKVEDSTYIDTIPIAMEEAMSASTFMIVKSTYYSVSGNSKNADVVWGLMLGE